MQLQFQINLVFKVLFLEINIYLNLFLRSIDPKIKKIKKIYKITVQNVISNPLMRVFT
jgi:hypothetical protein